MKSPIHGLTLGLALSLGLAGCQQGEDAAECGIGEAVRVDAQTVCVYSDAQNIIENGFRCPPDRAHRQEAPDRAGRPVVVCSAEPVDPERVFEARGDAPRAGEPEAPEPEAPEPEAPEPEARDPRREPQPEPEPPPNPEQPRAAGEDCAIRAVECVGGVCLFCADGLECVPTADAEPGWGTCQPAREAVPVGAACEPGVHADCGAGQGCARDGVCRAVCDSDSFECALGAACAEPGTVCEPAPIGDSFAACTPGAGDCADGEACAPSTDASRFDGFACRPSGGAAGACEYSDDCAAGSLCTVHVGWIGDQAASTMIFDLAYDRPARHPYLGRADAACRPACTADRDCGPDATCNRLLDPRRDLPGVDTYLLHVGACVPR